MLISSIIWLAVAVAVLAVFIVKYRKNPVSDKDVIYLTKTLFVTAAVIFAFSAVLGAMSLYVVNYITAVSVFIIMVICVSMMLTQVNQRVTMTGENSFVSVSIFGKKTEYVFSDFEGFTMNRDRSGVLYMTKGEIKVDLMARRDEKFFKKLSEAGKKKAYDAKKNK